MDMVAKFQDQLVFHMTGKRAGDGLAPIDIGAQAWVAADVFVGPGVTVGEGAVIGARSTVVRDVDPWTVVAGSPAVRRGERPRFVRAG